MADRLAGLCARMRSDFNRYLVPDGVVAGLAHFGPDGIEYFLHPRDRTDRRFVPAAADDARASSAACSAPSRRGGTPR